MLDQHKLSAAQPSQKMSKILLGFALWLVLITMIFSIPFLPLLSEKAINIKFLPETGSNQAIVLFGYSGCSTICSTQLSVLRDFLNTKAYPDKWPHVIFVEIDKHSSDAQVSRYVANFDSRFKSFMPTPEELVVLQDAFGLNIKQNESVISHSGRVFFLKRNEGWQIDRAYSAAAFDAEKLSTFFN